MFEHFYHEIFRRTIISFGSLFNQIVIKQENADDTICFDYTVLASGNIFFADSDELEKVETVIDERSGIVSFSNVGNCYSC